MQWSRILASFVLTCSLSTIVVAETLPSATSAKPELSKKSPQEIQEEKELKNLKPEEYRLLVLGTQIYLGRFGYGVGPFTGELDQPTQAALRAYQKNVGIAETGKINKETLKHLTDDNTTLDQVLPFLPQFKFEAENWKEMVAANGTWAMENLPVAGALQTSQISCHRKWNLCSESTAKLAQGYTPTLLSHTNIYEIDTWDDDTIVTKPSKTGPCLSTHLRIQREDTIVTRLTTVETSETGPCAKTTSREIQMQLANGSQIYLALKQRKIQDAQRILRVKQTSSDKPSDSSNP